MVKMYLADHRRGPVGDYQGLASFNLAPPPHQATTTVALQFIWKILPPHQATRVPFYCCTAIYNTTMCILYSSATSVTVAKIKVKKKNQLYLTFAWDLSCFFVVAMLQCCVVLGCCLSIVLPSSNQCNRISAEG